MTIDEKEFKKKSDYLKCSIDIRQFEEGIKITKEVWNKYVFKIEELIQVKKMEDLDARKILEIIKLLNNHLENFQDPKSIQKRDLACFAEKLTKLHDLVQEYAYPGCLDKCYQFIKTCLLKLYNSLIAGPGNLSGENVYIAAAFSGQTVILPTYRPNKYNYFICHEKLKYNAALLKEDFNELQKDLKCNENFQNAILIDTYSPKR